MDNQFFALDGPLDALPSGHQLRTANLSGFADMVLELGGDPLRILRENGLDPALLSSPDNHFECSSFINLLEHCGDRLDAPLFGLRLGELHSTEIFGCVGIMCKAAPTVREAIRVAVEYLPVAHSPDTEMELVEGEDGAELRWHIRDAEEHRHAFMYSLTLIRNVLRELTATRSVVFFADTVIHFGKRDRDTIEDIVGCRVNEGARTNRLGFSARLLDRPLPGANSTTYELLRRYLDHFKLTAEETILQRTRQYIRGALPSGNCSIERCAAKLGISVRTLQGSLNGQGTRFSELLETERIELARVHLHNPTKTLDDVASMLGYSDQTSFGRAFKRWTGTTPRHFRVAARDV